MECVECLYKFKIYGKFKLSKGNLFGMHIVGKNQWGGGVDEKIRQILKLRFNCRARIYAGISPDGGAGGDIFMQSHLFLISQHKKK